jgi:hypothetical protein
MTRVGVVTSSVAGSGDRGEFTAEHAKLTIAMIANRTTNGFTVLTGIYSPTIMKAKATIP